MYSAYFSDWLINSIQKKRFEDPILQQMADTIKTKIIENLTHLKKFIMIKIIMKLISQNKHLKLYGTTACKKFIQLKISILEVFQQT